MNGTDIRKIPPAPPGQGMQDCWFCYEFRVDNEDFVSPWFDDPFEIFDWLSDVDEYLITRRYLRTSDGIRELDGLGDFHDLPVQDLSGLRDQSPHTSAEDVVV